MTCRCPASTTCHMPTTPNAVATAWGQAIQRQREHVMKMSRAELAGELDVSREMVRLWETGQHAPSSRMQSVLIAKLGIDPGTVARLIQAGAAA